MPKFAALVNGARVTDAKTAYVSRERADKLALLAVKAGHLVQVVPVPPSLVRARLRTFLRS